MKTPNHSKHLRLIITHAGGMLVYHLRAAATMDALVWASQRMGNVAHVARVTILGETTAQVAK